MQGGYLNEADAALAYGMSASQQGPELHLYDMQSMCRPGGAQAAGA